MTTKVFTIREDHRLGVAGEIMDWANIRHVPVIDGKQQLTGLITHRDLLRVSLARRDSRSSGGSDNCNGNGNGNGDGNGDGDPEQRDHLMSIPVREVMSTEVRTIDPDATVQAAARLMVRGKYGCLPVVDSRNQLLGILSESDLLRILEFIDLESVFDRNRA